jgi:hypothetical protein
MHRSPSAFYVDARGVQTRRQARDRGRSRPSLISKLVGRKVDRGGIIGSIWLEACRCRGERPGGQIRAPGWRRIGAVVEGALVACAWDVGVSVVRCRCGERLAWAWVAASG